ncbi:MAG TPA: hypothetical protein VFI74_03985 [Candidatus Saccharimonadales bacterium]|nr:hypothetical protein [Candidatus Saccharimonadales bacterium]
MTEQNKNLSSLELLRVQDVAFAGLDETKHTITNMRNEGTEDFWATVPLPPSVLSDMGQGLAVTEDAALGLRFAEYCKLAYVNAFDVSGAYLREGAVCMLPTARSLAAQRISNIELLGPTEATVQIHGQLTDWGPALDAIENGEDTLDFMTEIKVLNALLERDIDSPGAVDAAKRLTTIYKEKTAHVQQESASSLEDVLAYTMALAQYRADPSAETRDKLISYGGEMLVALDAAEAAITSAKQPSERWRRAIRGFIYSDHLQSSELAPRLERICWDLRWLPELAHIRQHSEELDDSVDTQIVVEIAEEEYQNHGLKDALKSLYDTYDNWVFDSSKNSMTEYSSSLEFVAYDGLLQALVAHDDLEGVQQAGAFARFMGKARGIKEIAPGAMYEWQVYVNRGSSFAEAFAAAKGRPEVAWRNQAIRLYMRNPAALPRVEEEFQNPKQQHIATAALQKLGAPLSRFAMRDHRPWDALEYAHAIASPHTRYGALLAIVALTEKQRAKLLQPTEGAVASSS